MIKNKTTKQLIKKLVDMAKEGDIKALTFLIDRLIPKTPPNKKYKFKSVEDIHLKLRQGKISPQLAKDYYEAIARYLEIRDFKELQIRIEKLEQKQNK